MASKSLTSFAELTKSILDESQSGLTFNINDVESKVSKHGNVGYRVTCTNGQVITFFANNKEGVYQLDELIEAIDNDGTHRVLAGVRLSDDGSLIPKNAKSGGFWD